MMPKFSKRTTNKNRKRMTTKNRGRRPTPSSGVGLSIKEYSFTRRTITSPQLNPSVGFQSSGNTGYGLGLNFALASCQMQLGASTLDVLIPSYTEFSNLFDEWRIDHVSVKLVFSNSVSTTASATTMLPLIFVAHDYNDSSPPGSLIEMLSYQDCKIIQLGCNGGMDNIRTFSFRPIARGQGIEHGSPSGSVALPPKTFFKTANYNETYYGLKIWWGPEINTNAVIGFLDIIFEVSYTFRTVI